MKLVSMLVMCMLCVSSVSYSGPSIDKDKAMVISGVIAQGNILPLGKEMLERAERGDTEVQLIINSPGGEVVTGFLFLNLMEAAKAKGLRIVCFVPTIAASMAYQILLHCSERHALTKSFLLWHRARVMMGGLFGKPMTAPELAVLSRGLQQTDDNIIEEVLSAMSNVPKDELLYHFEVETLHTGLDIHKMDPDFLTAHSSIEGVFSILFNKDVPRSEEMDVGSINTDEIIYMHESMARLAH